ncbi:MAG: hypothetical protein KKE84_11065 [Gammaproteobacteria bacterium]|nr:hypothetical protein [Gammaproteobacteria bacterium]
MPLATAELRYLQWALAHHDGDRKSLADQLGVIERTLYRKLAGDGWRRIGKPGGRARTSRARQSFVINMMLDILDAMNQECLMGMKQGVALSTIFACRSHEIRVTRPE